MHLSIKNITYFLISLGLILAAAILAKPVFVPLAFGCLIAFMMLPTVRFLERKNWNRTLAILFLFFITAATITGITVLLSSQIFDILSDLRSFDDKLAELYNKALAFIENKIGIDDKKSEAWMEENAGQMIVKGPISALGNSILSSATAMIGIVATMVYTFLLLLYRTSIKNFVITQFPKDSRSLVKEIFSETQSVTSHYLYGIATVIVILAVLNSLGLWAIGIDYALFWGVLAALFTIVPFIGTFIGSFLPFLYALLYSDTLWQPAAIVVLFIVIQQLEDNLIKPKIVGSRVDINPLFAIFSMLLGGFIWGIAGLILAIPVMAILKLIFSKVDQLKALSILMGSEVYSEEDIFFKEYDDDEHRIGQLFSKDD